MADETLFEVRTTQPSLLMRLGAFVVKKSPKIFPREPADVAAFLQNRTLPVGAPMPARFRSRHGYSPGSMICSLSTVAHSPGGWRRGGRCTAL